MANRDDKGRFLPGWKGGPGRPRRAVEADYLRSLSDRVPVDKWTKIVDAAVEQALAGDHRAREWLGLFLVGKPTGHGLHDQVFAGWKGTVVVDADGGTIESYDATYELLESLTTTERFPPNGSQP
jgi:hypothetical protein